MIVCTQDICDGQPRIDGTEIPVWIVASDRWYWNSSVGEIALEYDITIEQVVEAMIYAIIHEQETREEIEHQSRRYS